MERWLLFPLRIPGGWAVRHNGLDAEVDEHGQVLRVNDSEDLLWLVKLPPPDTQRYETAPESRWREIHLDAGWYRDRFRVVLLDPDWDHVRKSAETSDVQELIRIVEAWLVDPSGR